MRWVSRARERLTGWDHLTILVLLAAGVLLFLGAAFRSKAAATCALVAIVVVNITTAWRRSRGSGLDGRNLPDEPGVRPRRN